MNLPPSKPNSELEALLAKARAHKMTPHERWEQRRSFVRGQMGMSHPEMTVEQINSILDEIDPSPFGPTPAGLKADLERERTPSPAGVADALARTLRHIERECEACATDAAAEGDEGEARAWRAVAAMAKAGLRAAAPQPPAPEAKAEPVAWRVHDFADGWFAVTRQNEAEAYRKSGHAVEPLYLAPPPNERQKVLTDIQTQQVLEALWEASNGLSMGWSAANVPDNEARARMQAPITAGQDAVLEAIRMIEGSGFVSLSMRGTYPTQHALSDKPEGERGQG